MEKEEKKKHSPEFISIKDHLHQDAESELSQAAGQAKKTKSSLFLHFFCFAGTLFFLSTIFFLTILLAVALILDLATIFFITPLHLNVVRSWKVLQRLFALLVGFFVGIFTPSFGVAIIFAYYLLQGEDPEKIGITRLMKSYQS